MHTVTLTVLTVTGMRNERCRARVSAALAAVPGVEDVLVSLFRARATVVHHGCDPADLVRAVSKAGCAAARVVR